MLQCPPKLTTLRRQENHRLEVKRGGTRTIVAGADEGEEGRGGDGVAQGEVQVVRVGGVGGGEGRVGVGGGG